MKVLSYKQFLENYNMDDVLDKISSGGFDSLTNDEKEFLKNYNSDNKELIDVYENNKFKFELYEVLDYGDTIRYVGELFTPELKTEYLTTDGHFKGEIIVDSQGDFETSFMTIDGEYFLEDFLEDPNGIKEDFYNFLYEITNKFKSVKVNENYKVGDNVSWSSEGGRAKGKITKVHRKKFKAKGYFRHASKEDPIYEIERSSGSGISYHYAKALRKIK